MDEVADTARAESCNLLIAAAAPHMSVRIDSETCGLQKFDSEAFGHRDVHIVVLSFVAS